MVTKWIQKAKLFVEIKFIVQWEFEKHNKSHQQDLCWTKMNASFKFLSSNYAKFLNYCFLLLKRFWMSLKILCFPTNQSVMWFLTPKIFPEVAHSHEIGRLPMDAFAKWENNKNNIEIKLDSSLSNTTVLTLSILSDNYHITRDVVT